MSVAPASTGSTTVKRAVVMGADPDGQPMISVDGAAPEMAEAVFFERCPEWAFCVGLSVLVTRLDDGVAVITALLGRPRKTVLSVPETDRMEAGKELVIACGRAKIALRSDGRIEIRGGQLVSRASGTNKIRGASVEIN
ncbi:MAG: hypothetical protein AAGG01_20465 [Planctomycetota bacterium]